MSDTSETPTPWPRGNPESVSSVEWATAFVKANPEAHDLRYALATWFLYALRSGYKAGQSHGEFPDA